MESTDHYRKMAQTCCLKAAQADHGSVNAEYKGKSYCFGNEQAKTDFMKDPSANLAKKRPTIRSITRAKPYGVQVRAYFRARFMASAQGAGPFVC